MRRTRVVIFCLLGMSLVHPSAVVGQFRQSGPATPGEHEQYQKVLWKNHRELETKMRDLILDEDDSQIEKVTLEGFNEDLSAPHDANNTLSTSTTDPALLAIVANACSRDGLLRPLSPPGAGMGIGGSYVVGTLRIRTTKHIVVILVTMVGFCFEDGNSPDLRHKLFYSWALAKVLDDMLAEATSNKGHISHTLFTRLSGESVIDRNRRVYWDARKEMENKDVKDKKGGQTPGGTGS
jgi:hypothetical protein